MKRYEKFFIGSMLLCMLLFALSSKAVTLLPVPQGGTGAGTFTSGECLVGNGTGAITTTACGGGYTNLTSFVDQTAWRVFYSNSLGDVTELALGTSGQYLKANGAAVAPTWDTPGGAGDMLKATYDTDTDNMVDTAEDLTCTDCINATEIEDIYILKAGYSTGALTSDLNIDSNGFVISYDDNKIGLGTATPAYKLDVVGSIQTDTAFRGDYWVSATDNSMNIQPTGDTNDFFSFKTPADRPTIKREGGKYIYIESTNIYDAGIAIRDGDTHSGTFAFEKDTNRMSLSAKGSPLIMKLNSDYDDYLLFQTTSNVPEMTIEGAADFKINAGGANALLLNHAGGNVAVGAASTGYILGLGTGDTFGIGTTQWSSADEIDGTKIKDADYGDIVIDAAGDWQVSEGEIDHDGLLNFVANEHLNWTADLGATNIHSGNYTDTNTTYTASGTLLNLTDTAFSVNSGTLTDGQYCTFATGTGLVCNSTPGGSGDITDVFDCATGNCSTMTVGTSEYLGYGTGYIDANRFLGVTTVDATEFGYLNGLTAAIVQTGSASHDGFSDYVANEHLDWTQDLGATNIHAGNYTDTNTTYTAGRSLTLDGTAINADSELYHHEKCLYFEDPTAADDFKSIFHFRKAATITGMWCESDQTVNMDLQLDDGTPADVNGTDLVCDTTPADDTSMGGDTGAAAGERLDLAITSVSGTPTWVSICFDFTYND